MAPKAKEERVDANCVYVGNMAYRTGWKKLKEHFGQAGEVKYTKVNDYGWNPFGRPWSKGTGLVEFADAKSAKKALQTLQGRPLFQIGMVVINLLQTGIPTSHGVSE